MVSFSPPTPALSGSALLCNAGQYCGEEGDRGFPYWCPQHHHSQNAAIISEEGRNQTSLKLTFCLNFFLLSTSFCLCLCTCHCLCFCKFLASQDALEVMRVTYLLTYWVIVSIDFTDVTLVSEDTYRRLHWCDQECIFRKCMFQKCIFSVTRRSRSDESHLLTE